MKEDHYKELIKVVKEEIKALLEENVDYIPIEKIRNRLEIIAAIQRVKQEKDL